MTLKSLLGDTSRKVLVAAHRGDWKNHPENSIPAVLSCIEKGIDIVEVDVQRTADGHYVLMHDQTVNRTTNGSGKVSRMSLAQVRRLRLKDRNGKLTIHRVPSLDSLLRVTKGRIVVNLDKSSGRFAELIPIIHKHGVGPIVILKGRMSAGQFSSFASSDSTGVTFMPILDGSYREIDSFLMQSHASLIEVLLRNDTCVLVQPGTLAQIRNRKCGIWYNALFSSIAGGHVENTDAVASWDWFLDHDARIIQTDYPFELMQHLVNRGLHALPPGFKPVNMDRLPIKPRSADNQTADSIVRSDTKQLWGDVEGSTNLTYSKRANKPENKSEGLKEIARFHTVRRNDTLTKIAKKHRLTLKRLLSLNPTLRKNSILGIGIKIRVK